MTTGLAAGRAAIRSLLYRGGIRVSRATDAARLAEFFAAVRPWTTNHSLKRIGAAGDGGYLVPDDLDGIAACFSPGVSSVADFELEMARRGIRCYLADHSVDAPPVRHPLFDFEKKFLGTRNDATYLTLDDWVAGKAGMAGDHVLQMDIEGAEYAVLLEASREVLRSFRVIVAEFHGLDALFDRAGFELVELTFRKLLRDFVLVHAHPNNCGPLVECHGYAVPPTAEFTFLRTDRVATRSPAREFPHPLDRPNVPGRPDVVLPRCWYAA